MTTENKSLLICVNRCVGFEAGSAVARKPNVEESGRVVIVKDGVPNPFGLPGALWLTHVQSRITEQCSQCWLPKLQECKSLAFTGRIHWQARAPGVCGCVGGWGWG